MTCDCAPDMKMIVFILSSVPVFTLLRFWDLLGFIEFFLRFGCPWGINTCSNNRGILWKLLEVVLSFWLFTKYNFFYFRLVFRILSSKFLSILMFTLCYMFTTRSWPLNFLKIFQNYLTSWGSAITKRFLAMIDFWWFWFSSRAWWLLGFDQISMLYSFIIQIPVFWSIWMRKTSIWATRPQI